MELGADAGGDGGPSDRDVPVLWDIPRLEDAAPLRGLELGPGVGMHNAGLRGCSGHGYRPTSCAADAPFLPGLSPRVAEPASGPGTVTSAT